MATAEKASLISHSDTSSCLTPVVWSNFGMARAGAIVKSMGAVAASANPAVECLQDQLMRWRKEHQKFLKQQSRVVIQKAAHLESWQSA